MLMDMDFKGARKPSGNSKDTKNLPGFRGSSEIPERSLSTSASEDEIASAFDGTELSLSEDPTNLTLERDKQPGSEEENTDPDKPKKQRRKNSKREKIILFTVLGLVILGALAMVFLPKILNKDEPTTIEEITNTVMKEETPVTAISPLSGLEVSPELASRPVTAVMIENSIEARPQSGLLDAELVFEAIAEGGVTRLVAMFQATQPEKIGPIRSARPYYVDLAKTFDAAYVHAGGSPEALNRIDELSIKDMSAFENNGTYYRADDREAPHDLYTSMSKLNERRTQLGFTGSTFEPWKRKSDTAQTPLASTIDFTISGPVYNVSFGYDPLTNSYLRSQNGGAHTDQASAKQITSKVVIGLVTSRGQQGIYSDYRLTGSGEIRVFQDGIISQGTWTKENVNSQFVFKDKNGLDFLFNKGQTWVTLVDSASDINYAP